MKTILQIAALMFLSSLAWGQESTLTVVDSHGNQTKISAVCGSNGDCMVWDSTLDEHLSFKQMREMIKWCNAQHISRKAEHGFADYNTNPSPCNTAWKQHKVETTEVK